MLTQAVEFLCSFFIVLAMIPVMAGLYQYLMLMYSCFHTHLDESAYVLPRVSILIPAWNEGAVIGTTIERLMQLNYPKDRLRVYVVDDASSDETSATVIRKSKLYPGRVCHIRRVAGGEGKAHTLNYGLELLWRNEWTEALLVMDADVIYTPDSLMKMARHLADPEIGAVTAYIKEGSRAPNYVQRYITFEYITATGCSRRAQNVMGFLACLSGGAQLHSRENLLTIGGKFFSQTLAEDTFTTFRTQLSGRRAIFEPNAIVYAEEPDSLEGLWKQRVRWGRGNVQITQVFRELWLAPRHHKSMGSATMAMLWFSIFLMPVFQISASASLMALYFLDAATAWSLFRMFWIVSAVVYLVVTGVSCTVDPESSAKSWIEGILFPGVISLAVIVYALVPGLFAPLEGIVDLERYPGVRAAGTLGLYAWLSVNMAVAYLAKVCETSSRAQWLAKPLLYIAGYGPFLCAVTFGSYIKELRGAAMTWDKTEKTGKVG